MPFNFIRTSLQKIASQLLGSKKSKYSSSSSRTSEDTSSPKSSDNSNTSRSSTPAKKDVSPRASRNPSSPTSTTRTQKKSVSSSATSKPTATAKENSEEGTTYQESKARGTSTLPIQATSEANDRRFYVAPWGTVSTSASLWCLDAPPQLPRTDYVDAFIELGIDFGTKYTKVCFRDIDSDRSEVITFANGESSIEQALILSRIEISQHGEIFSGLTEAEWRCRKSSTGQAIDFLKMRLAYLDEPPIRRRWLPTVDSFNTVESIENLSAYFLSSVIIRSQNWLRDNHPILFKGRSIGWVLNIGAPVAYWEGPTISRFERVLKMAWALSCTPNICMSPRLTLEQLNYCTDEIRRWMVRNPAYPFDGFVKPEIAAAVWSYIQATGTSEGLSIFFDIGDGTVEGAAFRYYRERGEVKIDFYSGSVEPLGVSALSSELEQELQLPEGSVKSCLIDSKNLIRSSEIGQSKTRKTFQKLVASVVVDGCDRHREIRQYQASQDVGSNLSIFIGGGGANIPFYRATVQSTHSEFNHSSVDIPPYRLNAVPRPKDLEMNKLQASLFDRFAIAYGLSMPEGESPVFDFPDESDIGGEVVVAPRI